MRSYATVAKPPLRLHAMPFAISIDLARCVSSVGTSSDADQAHEDAAPSHDAHDGSCTCTCTCASALTAECARSSFGDNTHGKHAPFWVSAERLHVRLSYEPTKTSASDDGGGKSLSSPSSSSPPLLQMVGIFVPSFLIEELPKLQTHKEQRCTHWFQSNAIRSEDILPRIHASLSGSGLAIRGILSTQRRKNDDNHDTNSIDNSNLTDLVLIEIPQREGVDSLSLLIKEVHGQAMDRAYNSVVKVLPLSTISFSSFGSSNKQPSTAHILPYDGLEIPSCPVCLHRIDPQRLGWPRPTSNEMCSQFCATSSDVSVGSCLNMRFLTPWQDPSYCKACRVIWEQWRPSSDGASGGLSSISSDASVQKGCYRCGMDQTLWVCLTCGVIGCGRYSHGHAKQHNDETGHPYSLELVTQRIWDYSAAGGGEFVQRSDLLNCSSMQLRLGKGQHGSSNAMTPDPPYLRADSLPPRKDEEGFPKMEDLDLDNFNGSFISRGGGEWADGTPSCGRLGSFHQQYYDPSPKKATMVGEEYEALLQSALEDQAQHYEGEITALIAALTAQRVDYEKMTEDEASHVEGLRRDIAGLRRDADKLSMELLDAQNEEAGLRATSQKLLREQAVSKKLLEKIKEEGKAEQDEAQAQVEELEQQVADLTANIRMRDQIKADGELSEAQIFGTTSVPTKSGRSGKRGKKGRRSGGSGRR